MIPIEKLKEYANLLMFDMKESEYETLQNEFLVLFKQMDLLGSIDGIEKYTPIDYPFPLENAYLRKDEVTMKLSKEEALSNSKDVMDDEIKVPKVVE